MSVINKSFFKELKPHSSAKVKLLENYINLWIRKVTLGCKSKCLICDTFAGEGFYDDGTVGSPIIILKSALDYLEQSLPTHEEVILVFIEADFEKYKKLKSNIEKVLSCTLEDNKFNLICEKLSILILNSTHENLLDELLKSVSNLVPSLFFIDPFGFKGINYEQVNSMLKKYSSCEIILNFMYEEFNRFKSGANIDNTLTRFFGSDTSLFKENTKNMTAQERRNYIINEYKNNFKRNGVKYTLDFDIQKDDSVAYKMTLIFASNNIHGFNAMKSTMLNLSRNIYFEYKTHENAILNLFSGHEMEMAISEMSNIIARNFKGKKIVREAIDLYCRNHDFIPEDKVVQILKCLSSEGKINLIKKGVKKSNPKQFPKGSIVEFL